MTPAQPYHGRDLPLYLATRTLARITMLVQSVAVGWQVYALTHSPLSLGIVGLVEFAPMFLLTLPAGEMADRFDQRWILASSLVLETVSSGLLLAYTLYEPREIWPLYAILALFGCARGFSGPAGRSLLPFLVPAEKLSRAIAWASSIGQVAVIAGPALGGFAYELGPSVAYGACLACFLLAAAGTVMIGGRRPEAATDVLAGRIARVKEGVQFVRSRPVVLGAISLDLFAVLLGGATALLPVYARDILHVGPSGLGLLRSAPAVGAAIVAVYLVVRPIERKVGTALFTAVAVFGVATIVFGLAKNFRLSLIALAVLGASDQVSVYIRSALVQLATPDPMRGRVSAVSTLFISSSNELGEFESGVTAALFGTVPAVILGGIGTLVVVAAWMKMFPPLRTVDRMTDVVPTAKSSSSMR